WAVICGLFSLGCLWMTGLAHTRQPRFDAAAVAAGQSLFEHEWQVNDPLANGGDGLGPVFNAKSCVACHFQGGVGGAGPNKANVLSFEVLPNARDKESRSGVVHAGSIFPGNQESVDGVSKLFPIVPGGTRVRNG